MKLTANLQRLDRHLEFVKPFFSILFIIGTLFSLVFLQMEERRLGYAILKLTREQRQIVEEKRVKTMALAKVARPQHVEKIAQRNLTLKKAQSNQIIHLTGPTRPPISMNQELN